MELTFDQALQKGVEAHKAGRVQEADRYYTAILKANPKNPDANHNMGVLAVGVGKVQEALPFFKAALEVSPKISQYWLSYIDALIKLDRITDAKAVFDQAKSNGAQGDGFDTLERRIRTLSKKELPQDPPKEQVQPLINLYSQGQYQEAVIEASQLLNQFPNSVNLYNIIGVANKDSGKLEEAIEAYNKALSIKPDYAEAYNNMGNALQKQGKLEEAVKAFNRALSIKPDYLEAYYNMGNVFQRQGKLDEAIEAYDKTLSIKPDYAEACNNVGIALKEQGKLKEAIEAYNKALSIKPDYAEAYNNMGNALQKQGKLEEAVEAFNRALSIKPDYAEACNNVGIALKEQGKLKEAIEAYNKALSIKPDYAEAYKNTTDLLKMYSPKSERCHNLFKIDKKIKKLSSRILHAKSKREILDNLLEGLSYISEDSFEYKTPLSQIYKRNSINFNCKRHMKIFETKNIIPEFCFGCFKVQVEVATVIDLIKVTSLFYKFDFEENLTKKTMIEMRPNIAGYYKGYIYCKGLDQAKAVKYVLDLGLNEVFGEKTISKIKRGCSEYPLRIPDYGNIAKKPEDMMSFPQEWKKIEELFDQNELMEPDQNQKASLIEYCLSDFYIIQKWIDYAKGIGDKSIEIFNDRPIIFKEIYETAQNRKNH